MHCNKHFLIANQTRISVYWRIQCQQNVLKLSVCWGQFSHLEKNISNYTDSTWMCYESSCNLPGIIAAKKKAVVFILICCGSNFSLFTPFYCQILVRWADVSLYAACGSTISILIAVVLLQALFFYSSCVSSTLFPRMSLSPLAAPDLPLRLLLNSFSVSMTCRGKDGNNLMQPCSSVSPDSGCYRLMTFPGFELLLCTHSSH